MCDPPLNSSQEVWPSPFGAHFHWWPSSMRPQPSPLPPTPRKNVPSLTYLLRNWRTENTSRAIYLPVNLIKANCNYCATIALWVTNTNASSWEVKAVVSNHGNKDTIIRHFAYQSSKRYLLRNWRTENTSRAIYLPVKLIKANCNYCVTIALWVTKSNASSSEVIAVVSNHGNKDTVIKHFVF